MAIKTCIPVQAKLDFLSGVHTLDDQYKLVLYTHAADLGDDDGYYTEQGEAFGKGYRAGGVDLKNPRVWMDRGAGNDTEKRPRRYPRHSLIWNGKTYGVQAWGESPKLRHAAKENERWLSRTDTALIRIRGSVKIKP